MDNKETIESLFEDVLYSYDDNIVAIVLHMSFISTQSRNNEISCVRNNKEPDEIEIDLKIAEFQFQKSKTKIDLSVRAGLEKYRWFFNRILDSSKDDINNFIKLSNFDLSGESDKYYNLEYYLRDIRDVEVHFPKLHKELTIISYNVNEMLEKISKGGK